MASSARTAAARPTLLSLLDGTLPPDAGEVERADGLRLARFRPVHVYARWAELETKQA